MGKYRRILLKLSGESLMGEQRYGIDSKRLNHYATEIAEIVRMGTQVAI
ncbi:MAG TPA: UMP kinase, partial [Bacteroidales bacterium]|nr:UMP kinase [Bacteroidales bacterium]